MALPWADSESSVTLGISLKNDTTPRLHKTPETRTSQSQAPDWLFKKTIAQRDTISGGAA